MRVYSLPDLFAGKLHAILCRRWKGRVKRRDWYDLVWYCSRHPEVRIQHLEKRMRQSGDYSVDAPLTQEMLLILLHEAVEHLNIEQAREEVSRFVRDQRSLEVWFRDFFNKIAGKIVSV